MCYTNRERETPNIIGVIISKKKIDRSVSLKQIDLYNNDCLTILKTIEDSIVDLVLTDPPYNLGNFMQERQTNMSKLRGNHFVGTEWDNLGYKQWYDHMDEFFEQLFRVSKVGSSVIVFMSLIRVESIISLATKHGFYYKTTGIWHKKNPIPRNMKLHFINSVEGWIYFIKPHKNKKTGKFNGNGKAIHDFIETSVINNSEKKYGNHPTQKPEELMRFFIELLSDEEDLVLDPFMGSGTSGFVALKNKRNYIGIEIGKEYFDLSKRRILGDSSESN